MWSLKANSATAPHICYDNLHNNLGLLPAHKQITFTWAKYTAKILAHALITHKCQGGRVECLLD